MRQQTVHAINEYIKAQALKYTHTMSKAEATRLLECASCLTPLVQHLGMANDL